MYRIALGRAYTSDHRFSAVLLVPGDPAAAASAVVSASCCSQSTLARIQLQPGNNHAVGYVYLQFVSVSVVDC